MNWCPYSQTPTQLRPAKCRRCGRFEHLEKTCNEPVPDPDAPPPAPPKPKRSRNKPKKVHVVITAPEASAPPAAPKSRKKSKKVHVVSTAPHLPLLQPPSQGRSQRRCMLSLLLLKHPSKHHRAN
ncbi:hypothetical protein GQ55_5G396700 [Panicum hallii var. hallii]|uniref:CCHC-type domain-containing protein n=1 Tax=Panicum hallii var. hallii TaxID=1504633 RepID=A0A2T7DNA6_9POAL|nr:hypothetical protein GQ55_5G396700 [Panicum hallii var. hallii]